MSERTPQDVLRELREAVAHDRGISIDGGSALTKEGAQATVLHVHNAMLDRVLALLDKAIAEAPDTLSEKPGLDALHRVLERAQFVSFERESDGSVGIEVWIGTGDGSKLLTGGATIEDACQNVIESWPDKFGSTDSEGR